MNRAGERFTKVDDELVKLGLPPRLVMLYGRLAYHAGTDGKCYPTHATLAREVGLKRRQVINLLNDLEALKLLEWTRGRRSNSYRPLDPDVQWIAHIMCNGLHISDVQRIAHRKEYIGVLKEVLKEKPPHTPPPGPGICASDDARVGGSALSKIPRSENGDRREWFAAWWQLFWRKVAKKAALKAFQTHVKTPERFAVVMAAVRAQTPAMMARDPDKRPHAATWLNGARWDDEPSQPRKNPSKSPTIEQLAQSIEAFGRTR